MQLAPEHNAFLTVVKLAHIVSSNDLLSRDSSCSSAPPHIRVGAHVQVRLAVGAVGHELRVWVRRQHQAHKLNGAVLLVFIFFDVLVKGEEKSG